MALAAAVRSCAWPPLTLLALLSLIGTSPRAGTVNGQTPVQVTGFLKKSAMLPCSINSEGSVKVTQVTWLRGGDTVAIFHPKKGVKTSERLQFAAAEMEKGLQNASLIVNNLTIHDEANYTCQFAIYPMGTWSTYIWLRVIAKGQPAAEALSYNYVTLDSVPVASCTSAGYHPPSRITWLSNLNGTSKLEEKPGPEPDMVTVNSIYLMKPSSQVDGQNLTCKVEHETLEEPVLLWVTLSVHYLPEVSISGYDGNWFIGRQEVSLTCDVRSNPEPTGYDWSTTSGSLPSSAEAQGKMLLIHTVNELVNTTFICRVTNNVGTGQDELYTPVTEARESEQSSLSQNTVIGITVSTIIVLIILGVVVAVNWKNLKNCGRRPYNPSVENWPVRYSPVNHGEVSLPQDTPAESRTSQPLGSCDRGTESVTSEPPQISPSLVDLLKTDRCPMSPPSLGDSQNPCNGHQ